MTAGDRTRSDRALRAARVSAYPPGEYVEQESFVSARGILTLAAEAGVGAGTSVLDLCCGVGGPGRYLTRAVGCRYLGVDRSGSAIALARRRSRGLSCRFVRATVPPLPPGRFEVVLLLETLLAFRDKGPLIEGIAGALAPGGRFACTVEEGEPLTGEERRRMPGADTVWPIPLPQLGSLLDAAGMRIASCRDETADHLRCADALAAAFAAHRDAIAAELGAQAIDDLLTAHRLWISWLSAGRIRKLALVATRS